jgi:surface antigen
MTNIPEATPVRNQADSESADLSIAPTINNVVTKPQVVATAFKSNKDIKQYTAVAGDTISAIASKFGITSDSIRWSNDISGDAVQAGTVLTIPPVSGIVYTVKAGDTPDTLAAKYKANRDEIIAYNDAELGGLKVGTKIILPNATLPAKVVKRVAGSSYAGSSFAGSAAYGYNGYDYGYCTWWVAYLRQKNGNPVPSNLGNASTWGIRARAFGLPTGSTPRVGAAVVTSTRGAGHVAYVIGVNGDGTIVISEMNHVGWNRTDTRTIADAGFTYIY